MALTGEEREHFATRGWVVIRCFLPATGLAEARTAWDRLRLARPGAFQTFGAAGTNAAAVRQMTGPSSVDPTFRALVRGGRLGAVAAAALSCDRVRLLQDVLLGKEPGDAGRIGWHQDRAYYRYLTPPRVLSVRLALDEETPESGGLEVLDASHLWDDVELPLEEANWFLEPSAFAARRPALAARAAAARTDVVLAPGDLSLHDWRTIHGSGVNRSDATRRTLACHVFDASCTVDPAGFPHPDPGRFPTDDAGRLTGPSFPAIHPA